MSIKYILFTEIFKRDNHGILLDSKELEAKDNFEPNRPVEYSILAFLIIFFIPSLLLYIKYRNHILIKYREPLLVIIGGILASINAICVPLIRVLKLWCIANLVLSYVIFSFVIFTLSKFIKIFYIQRLSIFKLKFSEKKNEKIHEKGSQVLKKIESTRIKNTSIKNIDNNFSNDEFSIEDFTISDPNHYFKKLNKIINKKIKLYYVLLPISSLILYYLILTIRDSKILKTRCINENIKISLPKLILNIVIVVHSIYVFYQAYYKQKWDKELRKEYTAFVIVVIFCSVFMAISMKSVFGDLVFKYRIYIFQIIPMTVHLLCIIDPLIKIYFYSRKSREITLTEDEFLARLSDTSFKEQVKDIATQTFCIENLLFFEAYCDLMNIIIKYYNKKNIPSISNSEENFSYSDVLKTDTTHQVLYQPFDPIFKPQYEQIYALYIKEDGIASINISSSVTSDIENQILNDNYSYLMFHKAAEEVGELLYSNIYPRMTL
ncbi:hypothetical protein BCR32DRAFT_277475 [Anaeromyces robustus]|uniref:RGS domain-containing protein n=1 Tax=Anaeromyces robustus TaxID=1754192 RepID=A0A1Y1XE30_9FUNG|nr:hypothetical protein BCR32DRAFT_277475 [Anaeromyces robustus]|eukprot:ORX84018.1 hypothetical protein BCR32DRAFT_277475 [Anaeromyces robustus]